MTPSANPPTSLQGRSIVLFGGDLSTGGGANRVVRDLATIFSERLNLDTTVISMTDKSPSYPFAAGVKIENRPNSASRRRFWRLVREVGRRKPDFVVGFWFWDNIRIALNAGLSGQRSIVTEHTSWHHPDLQTRLVRRVTYRWAKAVCVLNPAEEDHYRRFLNNVILLPNPVPPLSPLPAPPTKEKLVISVGHLIDRKNFRDAIAAMAVSRLANEGWRLVIIGAGPEQAALQDVIREHGLEGAAEIVPPTGEIAAWYARASAILVTSKIEVFSLVLAEAMSMQAVPIAYAADGPAYLLKDTPDLLVEPGDVENLGNTLRRTCLSCDLITTGQKMKTIIRDRFSEEAIATRWQAVLTG